MDYFKDYRMKKSIPLVLILLLSGCASNESMQSHYLGKAIKSVQEGDCDSARLEITNMNGRTNVSDENLANGLLIESSCYLDGDVINVNYAKGGYEYIVKKYPETKAGSMAKSILSDWDNVVAKKLTAQTILSK
jgi:hypothetical protein